MTTGKRWEQKRYLSKVNMQVIFFINFKLHGSKNTCHMPPFQAPSKVNLMHAARTIFLYAVKEQ